MSAPGASTLHPWNEAKAVAFLRDRQRLPHALLFAGPKGLGKNAFAVWLAQLLFCTNPSAKGTTCGHCQDCRLFAAGSHPDLHVVQPEAIFKSSGSLMAQYALRYAPTEKSKESKDSTVIRIDQIRSLIEAAQTRPQIGACTVMLLSPADTMNVNAANSLLKLLEEPPPDSYLILVADRPARLPATIRSRCALMEFRVPPVEDALTWLQTQGLSGVNARLLLELAGGAPLAALALATTWSMSSGARNCPFLMLTGFPARATAWMKSVWRQRNAGVCRTSTTDAAAAISSSACTSVSTGTATWRLTSARMRSPSSIPGPR